MRRFVSLALASLTIALSATASAAEELGPVLAALESSRRADRDDAKASLMRWAARDPDALRAAADTRADAPFEVRAAIEYALEQAPRLPLGIRVPAARLSLPRRFGAALEAEWTEFRIDDIEVTCFEYQQFVRATGASPPRSWRDGRYPYGGEGQPVHGVRGADARAFAAWVGGRLPTAVEWEVAGRFPDGRVFPWGREPAAGVSLASGRLGAAASSEVDRSALRVHDLAGSVAEWVALENGGLGTIGGHFLCRSLTDLRLDRGAVPVDREEEVVPLVGFRVVDRDRLPASDR